MNISRGGLISESFELWLKSSKKEDAQAYVFAIYFGDLSRSEKLSEIKPPWTEKDE